MPTFSLFLIRKFQISVHGKSDSRISQNPDKHPANTPVMLIYFGSQQYPWIVMSQLLATGVHLTHMRMIATPIKMFTDRMVNHTSHLSRPWVSRRSTTAKAVLDHIMAIMANEAARLSPSRRRMRKFSKGMSQGYLPKPWEMTRLQRMVVVRKQSCFLSLLELVFILGGKVGAKKGEGEAEKKNSPK